MNKELHVQNPISIIHAFPIAGLMDIPTGLFIKAEKGNWVMYGGLAKTDCIEGAGNTWKTRIALDGIFTILGHIPSSNGLILDTELSQSKNSLTFVKQNYPLLKNVEVGTVAGDVLPKINLSSLEEMGATGWCELVEDSVIANTENMVTLPALDSVDLPVVVPSLTAVLVDSFSSLHVPMNTSMFDENYTIERMREGCFKHEMIKAFSTASLRGQLFGCFIAHLKGQINMGEPKRISCPRETDHSCHNIRTLTVTDNKFDWSDIYPEKPYNRGEAVSKVVVTMRKNRMGITGSLFSLFVSPTKGVLKSVSEFHYATDGRAVEMPFLVCSMDLYPDVAFGPSTLRDECEKDNKLCTAIRLTSELKQMKEFMLEDMELLCTPAELYKDIEAMGYDWNILLDTRYWWSFVEDEPLQTKNELSIMDLLKMRKGEYHPYWLEDDKVTIKPEYIRK